MELNQRAQRVLSTLIQIYIRTGEPVSSRAVVKTSMPHLSAATVRNILAELDEWGYVTQPHTSAGRMPTDRGYRLYVDSLLKGKRLSVAGLQRIARSYPQGKAAGAVTCLLRETSKILSQTSHYVGLVMGPRVSSVSYSHMEFIRITETQVLVILVSKSGIVHTRTIDASCELSQEELDALTACVNEELCGITLEELRKRVVRKLKADVRLYQELLSKVFVFNEVSEAALAESQVYLDGTANILSYPDIAQDLERMKRIFQTLERQSTLVQLLDRSMHSEGVLVFIGSENPLRMLEDCSLVTANYKCDNRVVGTLGVIGPKRMDYSRVIPIVDYTSKLLSRSINC